LRRRLNSAHTFDFCRDFARRRVITRSVGFHQSGF
jgi:hypothetical protein